MAAPISICRLKLTLNVIKSSDPQTLWYSVDCKRTKTISCVLSDLRQIFGLTCHVALYIQNIIIPCWELCSHIFRDDDEVELRQVSYKNGNALLKALIPNYEKRKRKHSSLDNMSTEDNLCSPKKIRQEKKRDIKKKGKIVKDAGVSEKNEDTISCKPSSIAEITSEKSSSIHEHAITEDAKDTIETPSNRTVNTKVHGTPSVNTEGESSNEEYQERQAKIKKDRCPVLTPIEQQLIAELESLPKPKKRRKHKKKKSEKVLESPDISQTAKDESKESAAVSLNCSFQGQGVKKVFQSDEEDAHNSADLRELPVSDCRANQTWESIRTHGDQIKDPLTEPSPSLPKADKQATPSSKGDCFSSIVVRSLPNVSSAASSPAASFPSASFPAATSNNDESQNLQKPAISPHASKFGTVPSYTHLTNSSNQLMGKNKPLRQKSKGTGPVVYKREKLKLRATISPAILQHLQNDRLNESKNTDEIANDTSLTFETPIVRPSGSHPSATGSDKKIKWHKNKAAATSTPKSFLSKEQQLRDAQSNVSAIYQCGSEVSNSQIDEAEGGGDVECEDVSVAVKDYSIYSNLDGAPRVGDALAFKRLEVSADYTPVISDYKEGVVVSYEPKSKMVHVKLTSTAKKVPKLNGIFDVHIEEEGETLTNVDCEQEQIVDILSNLIEPKLITS